MAWVSWTRRGAEPAADHGPLGLDVNAGRVRGALGRASRGRAVPLDDAGPDLPLALALDRRPPELGRAALKACRKVPHLVGLAWLPHLGQPTVWKAGRTDITAADALALACDRLKAAAADHDGTTLALPPYLTPSQVNLVVQIAAKAKLRLVGTAMTPLALVADRLDTLSPTHPEEDHRPSPRSAFPANVLVIDADDHALTATLVRVSDLEVRLVRAAAAPRLGLRAWRERLLDALADRCIRLCRRDPRGSAEVEQAVYDQIDDVLDRVRQGQRASVGVRADKWFQDVDVTLGDLERFCGGLARQGADEAVPLIQADGEPPRAVWLTHDAARLPGLADAVARQCPERTAVRALPAEAAASAAAELALRWADGTLPRTHLDASIPLPSRAIDPRLITRTAPTRRA